MIIGLTGLAGAGKDTVGAYLVQKHNFKRIAFADKLKELAYSIDFEINELNHNIEFLGEAVDKYGWDEAKQYRSVRYFLQNLGQSCREVFGDDFWIDQVKKEVITVDRNVVITDVRYQNEFNFIEENGGVVIRVVRDVEMINNHSSEVEHLNIPVNYTVDNNTTYENLHSQIEDALENINYKKKTKQQAFYRSLRIID